MKRISRLTALLSVLAASLFVACTDADVKTDVPKDHNLAMNFGTADAMVTADIIRDMRLFTFYQGGANADKFRKEVYNLSRNGDVITATVETGLWHLAALSAPAGTPIIAPDPTINMKDAPMYKYIPVVGGDGKSSNAAEIFFANKTLPNPIVASPAPNQQVSMDISRNMAKVELVITKATATFNPTSIVNKIKLGNVPSTISYTGRLLPTKDAPTPVASPLESGLKLKVSADPNYLESETVEFIIPAHRGDPAVLSDTTTLKMEISVVLERLNGTQFTKTKEIPIVAVCNQILRVSITIDDGIEFGTELMPWEMVDINALVGEKYSNWLYVKKDAKGNGQSWKDALPTIEAALTRTAALRQAGKTVNGILVAGGSDKLYEEGISVPANTRIFGGWEGVSGTELAAADFDGPYTSKARDLSKFKAHISLGLKGILLDADNSVLDGFRIVGSEVSPMNPGPVNVTHAGAWINAIEMQDINCNAPAILSMTAGKATNILLTGCNRSASLMGSTTKLINATIAENSSTMSCTNNASLLNCILWAGPKGMPFNIANCTVHNCAIQGDNSTPALALGADNVPISRDNLAWFTPETNVPGPNFYMTTDASKPFYTAGSNRAPMVGRGKIELFNDNTTGMPAGSKKDINGNPRTVTITGVVWTDMGCYQEPETNTGFKLRWASDQVYISSRNGYITDIPLLLPENGETKIGLNWEVSLLNGTPLTYCTAVTPLPAIGSSSDDFVLVGHILLKTSPQTTGGDAYQNYIGSAERECGTIKIHTNLGAYLPDVNIKIIQTPGASVVWSDGYVGSFHRNNETEERYISGVNSITTNKAWEVRVTSGLDWIKIDGRGKGYNGGEVEDTFGGVVRGTGDIKFRVGMKSTYTPTPDKPARYGLITIIRGGGTSIAMFFVRQGEEADYLYGPNDPRTGGRADAKKFSPFNLADTLSRTSTTGTDLGKNGGGWTSHPSKIGYFFQWNRTVAYLRDYQASTLPSGKELSYSAEREVCPPGYRHGSYTEWIMSCYLNAADPGLGAQLNPGDTESVRNFVYGRYADGYYDKQAYTEYSGEIMPASINYVGTAPNVAAKGILMVNHNNYAALFFPIAGIMPQTSPTTIGNSTYCMQFTSTAYPVNATATTVKVHNTHWDTGHVGMSCTQINGSSGTSGAAGAGTNTSIPNAATVRCVKISND